jgi:hypothetical protein
VGTGTAATAEATTPRAAAAGPTATGTAATATTTTAPAAPATTGDQLRRGGVGRRLESQRGTGRQRDHTGQKQADSSKFLHFRIRAQASS